MANGIYRVADAVEYRRSGPNDLIELLPAPGCTPLFVVKWLAEVLVYSITHGAFTHLSGPTGTGKSSVVEALHLAPDNFRTICEGIGVEPKPIRVFPVEMVVFEAPGELLMRRALKEGATYDEESVLVRAIRESVALVGEEYPLLWLREIGRVHSSAVQGGLLNQMTDGDIVLPSGERLPGADIAWLADSNYQAMDDSINSLVILDDALRRRFQINVTLDYLAAHQEVAVLAHLMEAAS